MNDDGYKEFVHKLKLFKVYGDMVKAAARYGAMLRQVYAYDRHDHVSRARRDCFIIAREKLKWSYPVVGEFFNGRDHATVMSSVKQNRNVNKKGDNDLFANVTVEAPKDASAETGKERPSGANGSTPHRGGKGKIRSPRSRPGSVKKEHAGNGVPVKEG